MTTTETSHETSRDTAASRANEARGFFAEETPESVDDLLSAPPMHLLDEDAMDRHRDIAAQARDRAGDARAEAIGLAADAIAGRGDMFAGRDVPERVRALLYLVEPVLYTEQSAKESAYVAEQRAEEIMNATVAAASRTIADPSRMLARLRALERHYGEDLIWRDVAEGGSGTAGYFWTDPEGREQHAYCDEIDSEEKLAAVFRWREAILSHVLRLRGEQGDALDLAQIGEIERDLLFHFEQASWDEQECLHHMCGAEPPEGPRPGGPRETKTRFVSQPFAARALATEAPDDRRFAGFISTAAMPPAKKP